MLCKPKVKLFAYSSSGYGLLLLPVLHLRNPVSTHCVPVAAGLAGRARVEAVPVRGQVALGGLARAVASPGP